MFASLKIAERKKRIEQDNTNLEQVQTLPLIQFFPRLPMLKVKWLYLGTGNQGQL